jgi:hypothetical protein
MRKLVIAKISMTYIIEGNRLRGDSIKFVARSLKKYGLGVEQVPHKTTLKLMRPRSMSWKNFLRLLKRFVQPKIGSMLLFSCVTGKVFLCSNRGNRAGVFLQQ